MSWWAVLPLVAAIAVIVVLVLILMGIIQVVPSKYSTGTACIFNSDCTSNLCTNNICT